MNLLEVLSLAVLVFVGSMYYRDKRKEEELSRLRRLMDEVEKITAQKNDNHFSGMSDADIFREAVQRGAESLHKSKRDEGT